MHTLYVHIKKNLEFEIAKHIVTNMKEVTINGASTINGDETCTNMTYAAMWNK